MLGAYAWPGLPARLGVPLQLSLLLPCSEAQNNKCAWQAQLYGMRWLSTSFQSLVIAPSSTLSRILVATASWGQVSSAIAQYERGHALISEGNMLSTRSPVAQAQAHSLRAADGRQGSGSCEPAEQLQEMLWAGALALLPALQAHKADKITELHNGRSSLSDLPAAMLRGHWEG